MPDIGKTIHDGIKGIHGAGEAIRGEINKTTNEVFGDKEQQAENQAIADKGFRDMKRADETIGHNHGIGGGHTTASAAGGSHSVAPGNVGATGTSGTTNRGV